jgi:hypothetical protein
VKGWKTTLNRNNITNCFVSMPNQKQTAKIAINEAGIAFVSLGSSEAHST